MARHIQVEANVTYQATTDAPSLVFVLKDRRRKGYAVTIPNSTLYTKIVQGTNFFYNKIGNYHNIWCTGPILSEIVILVVASEKQLTRGINLSYSTQYSIHQDFLIPSKRFVWILGGWGPCSASCGGGKRQKTVACWDNQNGKLVKRKYCSLLQKPDVQTETCNTFGCAFDWFSGKWEPCSTTCGSSGIQYRELYCVPNAVLSLLGNNSILIQEPWKFMVNPKRCVGHSPASVRTCNRKPCFYYWEFSDWSQCSSSCGTGMTSRTASCPALEDGTCGEPPPPQRKICLGSTRHNNKLCKGRKMKSCKEDESKYCSFDLLRRYCQLKGFRSLCCKSCARYMEKKYNSNENIQVLTYQNMY